MKTAYLQIDPDGAETLLFDCPGCGFLHACGIVGRPRPLWQWNGSVETPTLAPSVSVTWTQREKPQRCHSFVRDGNIQFLADCTHALAGQTVPLPEWEL
jgi:hypothetical protein